MKIKKLKLLFQLLRIIQSSQRYCPDKLAKELNINKRTLCRYIQDLRLSGVPICYDRRHKCYTIDSEFLLMSPNFNFHEALGLLLLTEKLKAQTNTYFDKLLLNTLIKIEALLPDNLRQQCHKVLEKVSKCPAHQAIVNSYDGTNIYMSKLRPQQNNAMRGRQISSIKSTFENEETVSLRQVYLAAEKEEKVNEPAIF